MRLSDIGNKEIVDVSTGTSYGQLWNADMIFDKKTGQIKSVLAPSSIQSTGIFKKSYNDMCELPWDSIVIIGDDIIIFRSRQADSL
ncbi:MAG: YlmC/YmxH family sporulation protein [Firmicutes bacterium]|nr:YlmC/YmxH family sporulation protein [Bacillota bacterium]